MAPWIAGTSTILTSDTFHCAPSDAAPAVVMRSTTCVGGIPGGMIGAGRGGGACAFENVEIINGTAASTTHAISLPRNFVRISSLPYLFYLSPRQHQSKHRSCHTAHRTMCRQGPRGVKSSSEITTLSATGAARH